MFKDHDTLTAEHNFCIDIKDYKKKGKIGSGKYGYVIKAENKKSKELFAIKYIPIENENDLSLQNIQREIDILIRCQHPIIIKFHGYCKIFDPDSDTIKVAIVMDYAKNGSLLQYLNMIRKHKNADNTNLQIILIGIAYGMKYLHENHIIHRDLSSKNILLDENLYPYISDFGLSKISEIGNSMEQSQTLFTPIYFPPEAFTSDKYSYNADVYSFGIILYEVVTLLIPYIEIQETPSVYLISKVAEEGIRPKFNEEDGHRIKPSLKNLIELCWNQDPNQRPTFDQIFKMLAFNIESTNDQIDDKEQFKYYLDNVDINKIKSYIKYITKNENEEESEESKINDNESDEKKTNDKETKDNNDNDKTLINLENDVSINDFNRLTLREQYSYLSL